MKILVQGDLTLLKKIKKFACGKCGCIFEANESEYHFEGDQRDWCYTTFCPCCKQKVFSRN